MTSNNIYRLIGFLLLLPLFALDAAPRTNFLANGDFESAQVAPWEKRTPDDNDRVLSVIFEGAHSGKQAARISNERVVISRWRQRIASNEDVPAGAPLRLAGWIRTDLGPQGYASLRLYFMDKSGKILAQPQTRPVTGKSDWQRMSLSAPTPAGTDYLMVYLEVQNAAGTADFDDIVLTAAAAAESLVSRHDLLLLTDVARNDPTVQSLQTLYADRLMIAAPGDRLSWEEYRGAIVFCHESATDVDAVERFAGRGNPVVADLGLYARWRSLRVQEVTMTNLPAMRIVQEHPATKGFHKDDTIPWGAGGKGRWTQRLLPGFSGKQVLAESSCGGALLVAESVGSGLILATDLSGIPEPAYNEPGSFNKYLFAGNLLGQSVRYGRHYPQRLTYDGLVNAMRTLATMFPVLRVEDEGRAHGHYRIYSLNLGDPRKPAFLLYGATHGSEWEPAYGLLTLARLVAAEPDQPLFDARRYQLKMIPVLNPSGYDLNTRHSAGRVDLNRNGDEGWDSFKGRDSNEDGQWGPGDYDWKGDSPFSELETQTFRSICERLKPWATLDFHGNSGGRGNNRLVGLPLTARDDNEERVEEAVRAFNRAIHNRYVLLEAKRPGVQQYEIETIQPGIQRPTLIQTACRNRYGFLCEVPAGYRGTYGLVMQTDIVVETCRAFFQAFQAP